MAEPISPPVSKGHATVEAATADSLRMIIRIGKLYVTNRHIDDTIPITLESFGGNIAGFQLKFGTDNPYLDILKVLPGELEDSCAWEYFNAKPVNTALKPGYPRTLWQAVALAHMVGDTTKPKCLGFNREVSLLRLVVSNQRVLQMPETTAAIFFFWESCADNVTSGESGENLSMSASVFDFFPVGLPDPTGQLPTRHGAPRDCVNPRAVNKPKRQIEFYNGGVDFRYSLDSTKSEWNKPPVQPGTPFSPDSPGVSPN